MQFGISKMWGVGEGEGGINVSSKFPEGEDGQSFA